MNTKFFNRAVGHANILVGDNIDQLVSEAMNHVARLRDYYRNDIRQSLQDLGAACVSNHSTGDKRSLFVVLDKEHQVSDEDWQNMAIRDIATGSVLGLAELIGISHGKMRTLIGHLCAAGLITSESSNKGTAFRLTDRGEQVLNFTSADVDDFSTILSVIQRPFGIAILHIIKQLTHNAL